MNKGRPKLENKAKIRAMRFTDEEWQALTKLGRAKWIREQLKGKNKMSITENNHLHLVKQVNTIIAKLGLTEEQAWTEGGSLHAPRICNHIQETLDALAEANQKVAMLLSKK